MRTLPTFSTAVNQLYLAPNLTRYHTNLILTCAYLTTAALQILQISRPPSLPPLSELSRPELKLAGNAMWMMEL